MKKYKIPTMSISQFDDAIETTNISGVKQPYIQELNEIQEVNKTQINLSAMSNIVTFVY